MEKADLILLSDSIFTSEDEDTVSGYIAVKKDRILALGKGEDYEEYCDPNTKVFDLHGKTITPGFIDVHCFFTGYVIRFLGADLSTCENTKDVFEIIKDINKDALFGHGLKIDIEKKVLDEAYPDTPVVLFMEGCESCAMNTKAMEVFGFTPERCYPEAYVKIFPYVLGDHDFIAPQFKDYMKMMNSRGVTSVKEMGFDDFYTFDEVLNDLEKNEELTLRVNFMSQPVARKMDLAFGERMREKYHSDMLSFSGYNQMSDGSVSEHNAYLKKPYEDKDTICAMEIDWKQLEEDVIEADRKGFRFSLHCQGDGAIEKALDIFEKCKRDENGKVVLRQAMTDCEFSDPKDLERMGKLGVTAEVYPQIQSIANRNDKLKMIKEKIGEERGRYYWNRRKMIDSGVTISCGTDLPLLIDDIPESIYHAVGGYFPEGGEPFNEGNMLTRAELIKAWTCGGAYNLSKEERIGTLRVGKKADLVVMSGDLFETPIEEIRNLDVAMTIFNGRIVYQKEDEEDV